MLIDNHDFQLTELMVSPDDLLLDPANPRIQSVSDTYVQYSDAQVCSTEIQNALSDQLLNSKAYGVPKLIDAIRTSGFLNIDSIFVKRLTVPGKFLVLEGNRRTTAIKYLRSRASELSPGVAKSLERIPVKELVCSDTQLRHDMTAFILAIRHLGGVKQWEPMQQAYQIYVQYMKALHPSNGSGEFRKNPIVAERLAVTLNREKDDIWRALRIVRIYNQLREKDYLVNSDHYTMIDIAVNKYPKLKTNFLQFSEQTFRMSTQGLERFNSLCLEEKCKIKNPKDFASFFHVYRDGTNADLNSILYGDFSISEVKAAVKDRKDGLITELKLIKKKLEGIVVSDFDQSDEEIDLIEEIVEIVNEKLGALIME